MRHLILAFMIVLLPLRGWAGDVMAVEMASAGFASQSEAEHTQADSTHNMAVQAMPDCHDQQVSHPATDKLAVNDHCGTCQACQACHTVALSPSPVELASAFSSPLLQPTRVAAFTSASTALNQKPPIS